jgi:hypothetical protein
VSLVVFWYQLEIEIFCELEQLSVFRGAIKQLLTDWLHFNGCLALSANG